MGRPTLVGSGLVMPYPDPRTGGVLMVKPSGDPSAEAIPFQRVRLDDPSQVTNADGKSAKYLSRKGCGIHPYILPMAAEWIKRGEKVIYVTEGEKKALSAVSQGLPTIGLSGYWGWKAGKGQEEIHPLLKEFLTPGSLIVIIWDSDAGLNTGFAESTGRFHEQLRQKGCDVKVVVLPQEGTGKIGLDDFLDKHGPEALKSIVDNTPLLPNDRQVTNNELILQWSSALEGSFDSLSHEEGTELLRKFLTKGLVDGVDDETRTKVLERLATWGAPDVDTIFNGAVAAYTTERHAGAKIVGDGRDIKPGCNATTPDKKPVIVTRVDGEITWVQKPNWSKRTLPVSTRVLQYSGKATTGKPHLAGAADKFLKGEFAHHGMLTLRHYRGRFYRYFKGPYREFPDTDVKAKAVGFLREYYPTQATVRGIGDLLANLKASDLCYLPSDWDAPFLIGKDFTELSGDPIVCANGVLRMHLDASNKKWTTDFTQHTPLLFSIITLDAHYDPDATCNRWEKFLEEVIPNPELRDLLQEIGGYCLLPDTRFHKFFILLGIGANGKGVFIDVMSAVLGKRNVCTIPMSRFGERFSLFPLTQCLLNAVAEMPIADSSTKGPRVAEDKLKAIVSGDKIDVERKNVDIICARATAKLIYGTNDLPVFRDRSNGIRRRLIIVPFERDIPERERDSLFAKHIADTELSGVLNWMLVGLQRLLARVTHAGIAVDRASLESIRAGLLEKIDGVLEITCQLPESEGLFKVDAEDRIKRTPTGLPSISTKQLQAVLEKVIQRHPECPEVARTATGVLSTSEKHWRRFDMESIISNWLCWRQLGKLLQFTKPPKEERIHPKYTMLKRTGRTSCHGPNLQQIPRGGGIRECYVATPGHRLLTIDYSCVELVTLAAICLRRYGHSRLADVIREGRDPHVNTAALLNGMTLEEFELLKENDPARFKADRQKAKAVNFGLPGGLGADRLVAYAQDTYNVSMSPQEARNLRDRLTREIYPELTLYLADEAMANLAASLDCREDDLWRALSDEVPPPDWLPVVVRNIVAGKLTKRDGSPYSRNTIDRKWVGLANACRRPELHHLLMAQQGCPALEKRLFEARAVTLTGRIRADVTYTEARNTPFQGLAADGAKLACYRLVREGFRLVAFIHDEFVIELPEDDTMQAQVERADMIVRAAMSDVLNGILPVRTEYKLSRCWSKG